MNSALKPVGVTPSPVQQLNKHQQNAPTTYSQPISHLPQNLVNLPHSTPANAHSNNVHITNHYSVNASTTSQSYNVGASLPPPSNHPVANVNQSTPVKNNPYSSNTNSVQSYKISVPTASENVPDSSNASAEEPSPEKPQSNGTLAEKPTLEQEPSQNHQAEPSIKDKSSPSHSQIDVLETLTINIEKPSETIKSIITPEKSVEVEASALPVEQTSQPADVVEATVPETISSSKLPDLPEISTAAAVTTHVDSEPVVTSAPSIKTNTTPPPTTVTASTSNEVSSQIEKVTTSFQLSEATVSLIVKQPTTSTVIPPTNRLKEQTPLKTTLKLATTPRSPVRKNKLPISETTDSVKPTKSEVKTVNQKSAGLVAKNKRTRTRTQPYQCPLPEVEMISKISASASTSKTKNLDDKLIVFYKNEFLAVRNPEGGFYICQALHNIFKSTRKLRILWLSQDKNDGDIYSPDFYDHTDFDCILTNINLARISKGKFKLPDKERIRTDSILKRALAVEKGDATPPCPTEEHPDGLDLSLYKEESQLKKGKAKKRKASPVKIHKMLEAVKSPDQPKVRKVEPKPKPPPVTKALVIKKALAVKAKETAVVNVYKPVKTKPTDTEAVAVPKVNPIVDQKKAKVLAKVVKKPVAATLPSQSPSTSTKPQQPPRKQSLKTTDTVVPFLRKEPPILKKEAPVKKEFLVLKKESVLKKEIPLKTVFKKDVAVVRKEMPVLKKETSIVKKEVLVQKQVLTRKSNRGKK